MDLDVGEHLCNVLAVAYQFMDWLASESSMARSTWILILASACATFSSLPTSSLIGSPLDPRRQVLHGSRWILAVKFYTDLGF